MIRCKDPVFPYCCPLAGSGQSIGKKGRCRGPFNRKEQTKSAGLAMYAAEIVHSSLDFFTFSINNITSPKPGVEPLVPPLQEDPYLLDKWWIIKYILESFPKVLYIHSLRKSSDSYIVSSTSIFEVVRDIYYVAQVSIVFYLFLF